MKKKIILRPTGGYKDGGSKTYIGDDQNRYWVDNRIDTVTPGVLFLGKYKDTSKRAVGSFEVRRFNPKPKIFNQ